MATVKPILWSRKNAQGLYPVKIRITQDQKSKYVSLDFALRKNEWNPKSHSVRTGHGNHVKFNEQINEEMERIMGFVKQLKNQNPSAEYIWSVATGNIKIIRGAENKGEADFFEFVQIAIDRLKVAKKFRNARNTRVMLNKLKGFLGDSRSRLPLRELTIGLVKDFESYCLGKGNSTGTVAKDLARMRRMINEAIEEGLMDPESSPFLRFRIKQGKPKAKAKLSAEELQALFQVKVPIGSRLSHVQRLFRFQFYTGGIRVADCLQLTWLNVVNGRLNYQMDKTESSTSLPLVPPALEILDSFRHPDSSPSDFIFPFLSNDKDFSDLEYLQKRIEAKTALINKYLKLLAKKAGIKKSISTHVARHSMADYLRRNKLDLYSISKILRHGSLKTTENYLASLDEDAIDGAIEILGEL